MKNKAQGGGEIHRFFVCNEIDFDFVRLIRYIRTKTIVINASQNYFQELACKSRQGVMASNLLGWALS